MENKMYPLKLHLSAMAPETIVEHVAAKVHWTHKKNQEISKK
jgi:hypothetical protein